MVCKINKYLNKTFKRILPSTWLYHYLLGKILSAAATKHPAPHVKQGQAVLYGNQCAMPSLHLFVLLGSLGFRTAVFLFLIHLVFVRDQAR